MIELLVLIGGVIALYRFSTSTRAVAEGAETKAEVWAESVIMDATLERADNYAQWTEAKKNKTIVSHSTFMAEMKGE